MRSVYKTVIFLLVSTVLSILGQAVETDGGNREFTEIPDAIVVTFETRMPPYQYYENGQAMGFHVELMNEVAKEMGIEVFYLPLTNIEACTSALTHGEASIVMGILPSQAKGSQRLEFSEPISQSTICMMTAKDGFERKSPVTVSYQNEVVSFGFLSSYRNLRTIPSDSQTRAFEMMVKGKTQAVIGLKDCLEYLRNKHNLQDEYSVMENYMLPVEFYMMAKPEDQMLLRKLDSALYQVRISGTYAKLYNKWLGENNVKIQLLRKVFFIASVGICFALLIFITILRLNLLLQKQVKLKTNQLLLKNSQLEEQIVQTNISNEIRNCIVENSPAAIVVFNEHCDITMLNKSAQEVLFARNIHYGNKAMQIPLLRTILEDRLQAVLHGKEAVLHWNVTLQSPQSQKAFYQASLYPLSSDAASAQHSVRGAILTISDITKEIQIREQQAEKEKNLALSRMVASIAHEIRNPLMAIKTYTSLLPQKISNEDFRRKFFEYVPKEVDRANTLVTNLIDYAKPRSQRAERFDLNDVVESCLILIGPGAKSKSVDIAVQMKEACLVTCDKNQIKQVVINILINSVEGVLERMQQQAEFSGRIFVSTQCESERCILRVCDNGIGMTGEELSNATEAFFTTKSEGTGLGLALSKQLVEENNGKLLLQSKKNCYTKATLIFERSLS